MLTFHSIWTGPSTTKGETDMVLWDFEWLTWLTSLMYAKKAGPVVLVADKRGEAFVKKVGLASLYDEVLVELDTVPVSVDPELFWAAGKLYAIQALTKLKKFNPFKQPVVSLDWDCIPWSMPTLSGRMMCLNLERASWPWYKECKTKYDKYLPREVNWALQPANNGVICFQRYQEMVDYSKFSTNFMEAFSIASRKTGYFGKTLCTYGDAMTFAEQQLLASTAAYAGEMLTPFLPVREDGFLYPNASFTHLWSTKTLYRAFPEARIHYTNQLIRHLRQAFPALAPLLEDRELAVTQPALTDLENTKLNIEGAKYFKSYNVAIAKDVQGSMLLVDRNIPGNRQLQNGSVVLPGDRLIPASIGAKIDLVFNQAPEYLS